MWSGEVEHAPRVLANVASSALEVWALLGQQQRRGAGHVRHPSSDTVLAVASRGPGRLQLVDGVPSLDELALELLDLSGAAFRRGSRGNIGTRT